jgi:hypothetical protein
MKKPDFLPLGSSMYLTPAKNLARMREKSSQIWRQTVSLPDRPLTAHLYRRSSSSPHKNIHAPPWPRIQDERAQQEEYISLILAIEMVLCIK